LVCGEAEPRRLAAQHLDVVRDMVVEREIADADVVEPGVALPRPMALAQLAPGALQRSFVDLAPPMALEREFQFALRAHAREAEDVGSDHDKPVQKEDL